MKTQRTTYLFVFLLFISDKISAQPLGVQWDHAYGTNVYDECRSTAPSADGGYLLGGHTSGDINGSKTEPSKGGTDYWIIKIDASGKKLWDHGLGGTGNDYLEVIAATSDGGYILGGISYSGVGGDKTEPGNGVWIIKTNADGIKEWDRTYDAGNAETIHSLQQTTDGGYVFGGTNENYWLVKLNADGDVAWEKKLGGSGAEYLYTLQQTTDGGYILGGISDSGINGDKTTPNYGQSDYWIIKLDSSGTTQWDADFGGKDAEYLWALQQTNDGGFILMGESYSKINGNKTQPNKGETDYWAVKVNSDGGKEWDVDFGGSDYEYGRAVTQTEDGGFLLCGSSKSGISGDKTESCYGATDYWFVKIEENGNFEWDKRVGGSGFDNLTSVLPTENEGFLIGGHSTSFKGYDKSQNSYGSSDFWMVKLSQSCSIPASPQTTGITSSGATVGWNAVDDAFGYNLKYREVTATSWITLLLTGNSFSFSNLSPSTKYVWKVKWVCGITTSGWTAKQHFITAPLKLADATTTSMRIFPNPVADLTTIQFSVSQVSDVSIDLLDMSGRNIKTIAEGNFEAGNHQLQFEKENMSPGIYLLQLETNSAIQTQKLIIQ